MTTMPQTQIDAPCLATLDEKAVIATLKRLAASWPASLWLFSANGTLSVMKKTADGQRAMTHEGGFHPGYSVGQIDIENEGGDW